MKNFIFPLLFLFIISCADDKMETANTSNLNSSYKDLGKEIKLTNQFFKHFAVTNGDETKDIVLHSKKLQL